MLGHTAFFLLPALSFRNNKLLCGLSCFFLDQITEVIFNIKIMQKKTLNVAFSTQKGGAGKTTLTVLVSSYLHYVKGYHVAVIDCDFPQHSIAEMRETQRKAI